MQSDRRDGVTAVRRIGRYFDYKFVFRLFLFGLCVLHYADTSGKPRPSKTFFFSLLLYVTCPQNSLLYLSARWQILSTDANFHTLETMMQDVHLKVNPGLRGKSSIQQQEDISQAN